ncbi:MAG TPA: hypothetical protein PKA64_19995, partial [Myxococcota bacterium]|nr:hypothetical protein [Myxococcota bacterium]
MIVVRAPIEVWHADDARSITLLAALTAALPDLDLRPRGGHGARVIAVVLLCTPELRRAELGHGDPALAADLVALFAVDGRREPVVPVLVEGAWEEVAPEDLRDAAPFRLDGPDAVHHDHGNCEIG